MESRLKHPKHDRPLADPTAHLWDYHDVAHLLGVTVDNLKRSRESFHANGLPRPLPYNRRERLWRPDGVIRWCREIERPERSTGLVVVAGSGS